MHLQRVPSETQGSKYKQVSLPQSGCWSKKHYVDVSAHTIRISNAKIYYLLMLTKQIAVLIFEIKRIAWLASSALIVSEVMLNCKKNPWLLFFRTPESCLAIMNLLKWIDLIVVTRSDVLPSSHSFVGGLPDKKFEVDKRAMNLGDFNDIMRKDRSGFRPPNSKDMGTTDSGPYFEKVRWILLVRGKSTHFKVLVPVFSGNAESSKTEHKRYGTGNKEEQVHLCSVHIWNIEMDWVRA